MIEYREINEKEKEMIDRSNAIVTWYKDANGNVIRQELYDNTIREIGDPYKVMVPSAIGLKFEFIEEGVPYIGF